MLHAFPGARRIARELVSVYWVKSTLISNFGPVESMGEFHPHSLKKTAELSKRNLIGRRLRTIRQSKSPRISLEDLSGRLAARGVSLDRSAIGRIENGKRYVLDYEAVCLARALKVKLRDLFGTE